MRHAYSKGIQLIDQRIIYKAIGQICLRLGSDHVEYADVRDRDVHRREDLRY